MRGVLFKAKFQSVMQKTSPLKKNKHHKTTKQRNPFTVKLGRGKIQFKHIKYLNFCWYESFTRIYFLKTKMGKPINKVEAVNP